MSKVFNNESVVFQHTRIYTTVFEFSEYKKEKWEGRKVKDILFVTFTDFSYHLY